MPPPSWLAIRRMPKAHGRSFADGEPAVDGDGGVGMGTGLAYSETKADEQENGIADQRTGQRGEG